MKILFFIASLRAGGAERQLVELVKGLCTKPDIKCEIVIMSEEIHYKELANLGITVHSLLRKTKKDLSIFIKFYQLCKELKPDVIHSWNSMCSIYAVPTVILQNISFVNGFLRDAPPILNFRNPVWIRSKLTFPFSNAILSNSLAGLKSYHVEDSIKSICIYNGFDFSRIENLKDLSTIKHQFNIHTEFVIGMVASFSNNKDYLTFIELAISIIKKRDNVTFVAIGDGNNYSKMKELIPNNMKSKILFLGRQNNIEHIVQTFTIGVLFSGRTHGEGISNSIMEYMALRKPVVATNSGGNSELIIDNETGYLVQNENLSDIASKIEKLLNSEELTINMGDKAENVLKNNFSFSKLLEQYTSLYQSFSKNIN